MITRYQLLSIILGINGWEDTIENRCAAASMTDNELSQVFRHFTCIRTGYYLLKY